MSITRPKVIPKTLDGFIAGAPDGAKLAPQGVALKAKRGIQRSQVSVVLADSLLAEIDRIAHQRYMSRSALITMALHQFLGQESRS